ncbi:MAG: ribosome recycling factor [Candidatus Microsaccharimonas sossegonensis]|uniref:Ribosome-recycling factor n=1 Tax=Candidatus Microsaccharimonas sossegonensis TaxID=2506948 RepID=A0A4Q0AHB9_9BACT|nr:MAG: ribosome recycling factor [Candidatus Microsaccharimonas sossegonensis]
MFDTKPYEARMSAAVAHFQEELKRVRTGRAHPSMLDSVQVEAYGQKMPLNQVANVTAAEPQLLTITPFNPSNIQVIAAGIRQDQSLGLNPSDDGRVIRVPIPPLTEERRKLLVKQTSEKVEAARITLRNVRQDALKEAKRRKEAKAVSEDDLKTIEKSIDASIASFNAQLDASFKEKEKDILTL